MRRFDFKYFFTEALQGITRHAFMSFAAVGIIMACLLIMGSFSLVAVNLEHNLSLLMAENQFLAYVDENYTEDEARALESKIQAVENVSEVTFITKGEAKENYLAGVEDNQLYEDLPDTVFRDRYAVHVKDITLLSETIEEVGKIPGVVNISAALEVAEGFVALRNISAAIAIILVAILLVISLFIISNTIKLATFTRRDEIAIMKMCGATDGFIRWPFVFEGMILGLLGAVIAFLLQWGIYSLIVKAVGVGSVQFIKLVPFSAMALPVFAIFAGTGLAVGVGGSVFTIRKFLQV